MQTNPVNPIEAVIHPNPYPYYAQLAQHQPIYQDEILGMWVASSADTVKAVLTHPLALVRPANEPVPGALLDTPIADIFGKLVRMNDGAFHEMVKSVVSKTLAAPNPVQIEQLTRRMAQTLLQAPDFEANPGALTNFAFQLPVYVVASLLGIEEDQLFQISDWVKDFVVSLTASSGQPDRLERGKIAATHLLEIFYTLLAAQPTGRISGFLLARLAEEAYSAGGADKAAIVANAIGFLSQTHEATAGLIGNVLVTLATHPEVRSQVMTNPDLRGQLIQEVLRYDPPVQNTRRFMAGDATIAGHELKAGETVLVALAAANRDPFANPDPDRFNLFRANRQMFSFGVDRHACPGHSLAGLIAKVALAELFKAGLVPERLAGPVAYRPSVNARIPIL